MWKTEDEGQVEEKEVGRTELSGGGSEGGDRPVCGN